jgi:hypothetical protein
MQGAQILRSEAYLEVRRNDEGCSATPQMDFLRSHPEYNEAISHLSRLKCVSLPFFKNVGLLFTYSLWPEGYLDDAKWFKGLKGQGSEVKRGGRT